MHSKLGLHVATGSRNGYGLTAPHARGVVVFDGGGALDEVSAGTFRVYRPDGIYAWPPGSEPGESDIMPGFDSLSVTDMQAQAEYWWPLIKARVEQVEQSNGRIDAIKCTNETGGNDPEALRKLVEYERHLMRLAHADGRVLLVANLATNSPHWGNYLWQSLIAPFVVEAWALGHIYNRHAYADKVDGVDRLIINGLPAGDSSGRPFKEIEWFRSHYGYCGPIILVETGFVAHPGDAHFMQEIAAYDAYLQNWPEIGFGALFTYGKWWNANIETASTQLAAYLTANKFEVWQPQAPVNPPPEKWKAIVVKAPQEISREEWLKLAGYVYEKRHTMTASHDDTLTILKAGNADSYAKIYQPDQPSQAGTIEMLEAAALRWEALIIDQPPAPQFSFTHWPTDSKVVTQKWGNDPTYYAQYGLPGHEGADIRAAHGSPIRSVAAGTVAALNLNPDAHNYGIFVRIDHADGWQTTYAHLERTAVVKGQVVVGGHVIGYADDTGNSFGSHLHLGLKRPGKTYKDQYGAWPYSLFDPTPYLTPFAPTWPGTTPPPTPQFDMADYLPQTAVGQWLVMQKSEGGTIDHQIQNKNGITYLVKSAEAGKTNYEELRLTETAVQRRFDTSPEPGRAYKLDDGSGWSDWMPRRVNVGTIFRRAPRITWYDTNNGCRMIRDDGQVTTYLRVAALHDIFTAFPGGKSYTNVLELQWLNTPTSDWVERYFVAPGRWYVCWQNKSGAFHYADDEPQGRPPLALKVISCLA